MHIKFKSSLTYIATSVGKQVLIYSAVGMQIVQPIWKGI